MRVLLTGAGGLVGRYCAKVLAKAGDLLYFPKGTSITFSTDDFGLGFFCGQRGEGEA